MASTDEPQAGGPADTDAGGDGTAAPASADEELLSQPLDDGDLEQRINAAGGRRWRRSTVVLAALALVVFGFALGAAMGRGAAEFRAAMEAGQGDDAPAEPSGEDGGRPVEAATDEGAVEGTVRAVDGDAVYVEASDGTVVRVETSEDTLVTSIARIEIEDLVPGAPVVIQLGDKGSRMPAISVKQSSEDLG